VRVVFLTHNYPRWSGDLSGGFLSILARALVARGVGVQVIAPSERGKGGDEMDGPVRVRRVRYGPPGDETLGYGGMITSAVRSLGGVRRLVALGRSLRAAARDAMREADVVHAHWWVPAGLAAPPGMPIVLTSHGTDAALLRRSAAARMLARPVYARAAIVTAVSSQLGRWITDATGRTVDAAHVHPMPVDVDAFRPSQGGGGAVVVARLTAQKRVGLALGAIATLRDRGTPLPLTIAGDGPERAGLERSAAALGITDLVTFRGAVATDQVPELLSRADVMLATAAGEGFGLAAAEALMAGVPVVVCADGGGLLDVVSSARAGRIVEPAPELVAAAAAELIAPAARTSARDEGERWRRQLSGAHVADVCAGWYEEALRG
jgi:glycosyltransferase involved in cell wall biosynthesis